MTLPEIPIHDYRLGGMLAYQREAADRARRVMETVLTGMGLVGRAGRLMLPLADRAADKRLTMMMDPYQQEIRAVRRWVGRPGPVAFSLSYEFGCTARAFDGPEPMLFRTLDWPFRGIGALVEIVALPGKAGDWIAATWPGVVGCLQGMAPGRFAAAINQAPERMAGGRARSWLAARLRMMRGNGMAPTHLLRLVFETAPDFETAHRLLSHTPVAAPVIFSLTGVGPGEVCVIERTETNWAQAAEPAAANHFASELALFSQWRSRGVESEARRTMILAGDAPPAHDALAPPVLNALTRLAVTATAAGALTVTGFDGENRLTATATAEAPAPLSVN